MVISFAVTKTSPIITNALREKEASERERGEMADRREGKEERWIKKGE